MARKSRIPKKLADYLQVAPLPESRNLYTSYPKKSSEGDSTLPHYLEAADDIMNRMKINEGQALDIVTGNKGLAQTQRAMSRIRAGAPLAVYDIENLGSTAIGNMSGNDTPMFGITQLAIGISESEQAMAQGKVDIQNIVFRQSESVKNELSGLLDRLESNWQEYDNLTEDQIRSLADLGTFSKTDLFGGNATIGGKTYKSLPQQANPINQTKTALTNRRNIEKMRQGLSNITNPELTTDPRELVSVVSYLQKTGAVMVGHNVERHDQPGIVQALRMQNASKDILNYVSQPQVDTYRLAEDVLNKPGGPKSINYRLGTIYSNFTSKPYGEGQAHNAGFDVGMNVAVYNQLAKKTNLSPQVKGKRINKGDEFYVRNGMKFYESSFNQNAGQYDMVTVIDPDTGKHKLQYNQFRRSTGRGNMLEFKGQTHPMDIDGTRHFGITFFNPEEETYHHFFRSNRGELDDIFGQNLVDIKDMPQDELDYIRKDNARRRYSEIFTKKAKNDTDTVSKRLSVAREISDVYEGQIKELTTDGSSRESVHQKAIDNTMGIINDKKEEYKYGRKRIEQTAEMSHLIQGDMELFKAIETAAVGHAGVSGPQRIRTERENRYFKYAFNSLAEAAGPEAYGYDGLRMLKLPDLSNPGEYTHRNVTSPGQLQAVVRNELKQDMDRAGRGKTGVHFERLMSTAGGALDDKERNHLKRRVDRDLKRGEVSSGTVDEIANLIHRKQEILRNNGVIVNSLPGVNLEKPFSSIVFQDGSDLLNKTSSQFFKDIQEGAKQDVDRHIARGGQGVGGSILPQNVVERFKKSDETQQELRNGVIGMNQSLGMNMGRREVFSKGKAENKVSDVINNFKAEGFQVKLEQVDGSDRMLLFATADTHLDLTGMSIGELQTSDKVFGAPLPLYNENMAIDTLAGEMRDIQHVRMNLGKNSSVNNLTANDIKIESTSDLIFNQLNYSASNIKKEIKRGGSLEEAISKERGNLYRTSERLGIPSGYRTETAEKSGYTAGSREGNRMLMINSNEYNEAYVKENYPNKYKQFLARKSKDSNANVFDVFGAGELSKLRMESWGNWNTGVGAQSGVYLRPEGLNPNQAARGMMNLMPPSLALPFAQMHSPIREQANKSINYRTVDRVPMDKFLRAEYANSKNNQGQDSLVASIMTKPAQTQFSNLKSREENIRAYELPTLQASDNVLARASLDVRDDYQSELDKIIGNKNVYDLSPTDRARYNEVKEILDVIDSGRMSTFEDQYILSDKFLGAVSSSEHLEIDLKNYELTDELKQIIRENSPDGEEVTQGRINFGTGLTYSEMQRAGIVSEDGMLTVGQLSQDVIANSSGIEYSEAKRRRIQKGAQLHGIEISPEGRATLIVNNRYEGMTGNKTLRTATGTRETGVATPGELVQAMAEKITGRKDKVFAITAFEKGGPGGRRGTGGMYTDLINTSAYNVRSAIDNLYDGNASTGVSGVDSYFKGRELSGNRFTDYQNYIKDVFIPDVNKSLGSEQIGFFDESGGQPFQFLTPNLPGTPEERQGYLRNLKELAEDKYGMKMGNYKGSGDYMLSSVGFTQHNIPYWQGNNVKARYGRVELDLIDQALMGPSKAEVAKFRHFSETVPTVDGVDLATYEGFSRAPGQSIISQNLRELSKTKATREETEEYIRRVQSAKNFYDNKGTLDDITNSGNIIVDIAGDYDFEEGSNFLRIGEGSDAYTVVDGSTIGVTSRGGIPSGAELKNTYRNIYSVDLYSDTVETTIGDLVEEQNSSVFVKMLDPDHPMAESAQLENQVVEVVPMLKSKQSKMGDVHLLKTELSQAQAFEAAYEVIHGAPGGADPQEWYDNRANRIKRGLTNFLDSSNRFIGSDAAQQLIQIQENNSFAANFQGRNILNTNYRVRDMVMSESQARLLMDGRIDTILDANKVSIKDIIGDASMLTQSEIDIAKEDYIINRLRGEVTEDNNFEFYSILNRQPSQNEASLIYGSVRIDERGLKSDTHISLDPRQAGDTGGDFDGDIGYVSSYPYLENMSPERAALMQAELREMVDYSSVRAVANNHTDMVESIQEEGVNSLQNLLGLNDPLDVAYLFGDNLTDANAMFQIMSDETMRSNVGSIYNNVVGTRDALNFFASNATEASQGNIVLDEMRSLTSNATSLMDKIQQSAISRKKMEPAQIEHFMGAEPGSLSPVRMAEMVQTGELMDVLTEFDAARASIPSGIRDVTIDSASSVLDTLERLSILDYKDDEQMLRESDLETLIGMGRVQEAMSTSPLGGFENPFFRMGTSSASDEWINFEETLRNAPEQVPITSQTTELAEAIFSDEADIISNWQSKQKSVMQGVSENYQNLVKKAGEAVTGSRAERNLIEQLSASKAMDGAGDQIRSQSGLYNSFTEGVGALAQSTAFRAAAGVTAAWAVARAMSSGPTPEGNLAEQEMATAEEVSPSQLLTSPTARITPGAQSVNLNIQASGNLSEQEVAGLINNEISAMTGSPMQMNINVNDNTAKLDRKFYQRAVDRVFGF